MSAAYLEELENLIQFVCHRLDICADIQRSERSYDRISAGRSHDAQSMCVAINRVNQHVVESDPFDTTDLREYISKTVPRVLFGYLELRFPHIADKHMCTMPVKSDLSKWPDRVVETGVYVPVTQLLRLLAVSLAEEKCKALLVANPDSVKTILSHCTDDPLIPFQRENGIFVLKTLTMNSPASQAAISKLLHEMRSRGEAAEANLLTASLVP